MAAMLTPISSRSSSAERRVDLFSSTSPLGYVAGDPNLYRYVGNNPLNFVDPSGLDEATFEKNFGLDRDTAVFTDDKQYLDAQLDGETPTGESISFRFLKAMKGQYFNPAVAGGKGETFRAVYAQIQVEVQSDKYSKILFLQVLRETARNANGDYETQKPLGASAEHRRQRAGYLDEKNAASLGWYMDRPNQLNLLPFFGNASGDDTTIGEQKSILYDAPGSFMSKKNVGREFITAAIGLCREDSKYYYLGSIRWGYYVDSDYTIRFEPASPTFIGKAPAELKNTLGRWNTLKYDNDPNKHNQPVKIENL